MSKQLTYTFKKAERLKSRKRIAEVFAANNSVRAYPFLLVYLEVKEPQASPVQIAFSVPRKRFRKATKRNHIKRLMREVWRLNKHSIYEFLQEKKKSYAFVLVYVGKEEKPAFRQVQKAIRKLIVKFVSSALNGEGKEVEEKGSLQKGEKRVLILCTGNSCRSQMAEGFLKSLAPDWDVWSAGTAPALEVHPKAVAVMRELDIDIGKQYPKPVDQFLRESFDYVITVCGDAEESCPQFTGRVKERLHMGFEDPAKVQGSEEEIVAAFRRIRDEIKAVFIDFMRNKLV